VIWWLLAVAVVLLLGAYARWMAGRLDRLHARLDAATAGLDEMLRHRAAAAAEILTAPEVVAALTATGIDRQREAVENAVSRHVRALGPAPGVGVQSAALADAWQRAAFARSFYNDAVRDALVLRRRWVVRLLHLAGHARAPSYFEIDDAPLETGSAVGADRRTIEL
jgi:hypothetical protein